RAAKLIQHDRYLYAFLLELRHQVIDLLRFGNKIRLTDDASQHELFSIGNDGKDILGMDNSDDLVNIVVVYRNTRISFLGNALDEVFTRAIHFYGRDLRTGHHDIFHDTLVEVEYVLDQFMLNHVQRTAFTALVQQVLQFLGGVVDLTNVYLKSH